MAERLSQEDIETIRTLRSQKNKIAYIAFTMKISPRTVTDHLINKREIKPWTQEEMQLVIYLKNMGMTYRQIGKEIGRTKHAVTQMYYKLIKKF